MKTLSTEELKARCMAVLDDIHKTREPVLITKDGQPLVRLEPFHDQPLAARGAGQRSRNQKSKIENQK